jgi:hypothetical protein
MAAKHAIPGNRDQSLVPNPRLYCPSSLARGWNPGSKRSTIDTIVVVTAGSIPLGHRRVPSLRSYSNTPEPVQQQTMPFLSTYLHSRYLLLQQVHVTIGCSFPRSDNAAGYVCWNCVKTPEGGAGSGTPCLRIQQQPQRKQYYESRWRRRSHLESEPTNLDCQNPLLPAIPVTLRWTCWQPRTKKTRDNRTMEQDLYSGLFQRVELAS